MAEGTFPIGPSRLASSISPTRGALRSPGGQGAFELSPTVEGWTTGPNNGGRHKEAARVWVKSYLEPLRVVTSPHVQLNHTTQAAEFVIKGTCSPDSVQENRPLTGGEWEVSGGGGNLSSLPPSNHQ